MKSWCWWIVFCCCLALHPVHGLTTSFYRRIRRDSSVVTRSTQPQLPSAVLSRLLQQGNAPSSSSSCRPVKRRIAHSSTSLAFGKSDDTTPNTNISLHQKIFQFNNQDGEVKKYLTPLLIIGSLVGLSSALGQHLPVNQLLEDTVHQIAQLGPYGYFYFSLVYIAAELLAIPAMPLTASSGYLFGLIPGTLLVLSSATIAAAISFYIGRTFLRSYAQEFIQKSDKWRAVDKAIAKEGFKVILLLRLSPLLPFALSNYLYAVTSVDFL